MIGRSGKVAIVLAAAALLVTTGCTKRGSATSERSFKTPDEAVAALVAAIEADDAGALQGLLGPGIEGLLSSGDAVSERSAREAFLRKFNLQHQLVAGGPDDLALQVGDDNWPLPIPLVKHDGSWHFDGAAGAQELILRRIGRNELQTIDVMRGYVAAQEEYASAGHDGLPAGNYAQRLRSQSGKQDGLYWEVSDNKPPSPAGPLLAAAAAEGYGNSEESRQAYHGYVFRMLYSQGPAANGGPREFVQKGQLAGGFALLATPALYGVSGVMTFIVNQDGVVWQRDLGDDTPALAPAIDKFNPDTSWTPIAPDG